MILKDLQEDGSFGKFYGVPNNFLASRQLVCDVLNQFELSFIKVRNLLEVIQNPNPLTSITQFQNSINESFKTNDWCSQPNYPNSRYKADFGKTNQNGSILVEVELSDVRRSANILYMMGAYRMEAMKLGIVIVPENNSLERTKNFYSNLTRRFNYFSPDFPLWLIGFDVDHT